MATYSNQIALFDTTNAKYILPQSTDIMTLDIATLTLDANTTVSGNLTIDENLTVKGTTTTVHSETVLIKDNFLDLNHGYSSSDAQQGGITINYAPDTAASTTSTAFTAGAGSDGPVIAVASNSGFANFDVIQVSNATDPANDGIYILKNISGTNFTLMGTGGTGVPAIHSWAKNQLTTNGSDTAATVIRVAVSVMKANTSGDWQIGKGSNITNDAGAGIAYSTIQTGTDSTETLQTVYANGNTITTSGANGNVIIAGDQALSVSATGGVDISSGGLQITGGALDIDTTADFNVTSFDVEVSGAGFSIDGAGASNVTTSSGNLTLTSAATMDMDAVTLDLDSSGATNILAASTLSAKGATGASFGDDTGSWEFNGSGAVTETGMTSLAVTPSGAITLTAGAASTVSTSSGKLTLSSASALDLSDGTATLSLASGALTEASLASIDLTPSGALTLRGGGVSKFGDDVATWDFNGSGAVSETGMTSLSATPSGAITMTGGAASTFSTSSGAATVSGAGGLSLLGNGSDIDITTDDSGVVDIDGGAAVQINATQLALAAGSSGFALDGTGASRVQTTGANLNLNTVSSGKIVLDSAANVKLDPATAAFTEMHGFTSVAGDQFDRGQVGIYAPAKSGVNIAAGEMVFVDQGGYNRAVATDSGNCFVSGCAYEAISGGSNGRVATLSGSFIKPIFDTATQSGGADAGRRVYLSTTTGKVSFTPPSLTGQIVYQVGYCVSSDGNTTNNYVAFFPQYLMEIP
jgi:hypothetical protein